MIGAQLSGGMDYTTQNNAGNPLLSAEQRANFPPAIQDDAVPIVVPTVLQLSRAALQYWQGMTCFFSKHWFPDRGRATLPFCFFHVVKYSESVKADVSTKRVILYEPEETVPSNAVRDPVRPGLMQTIADNIVLQPKEYKLEVVVPFTPLGRYVRQGADTMRQIMNTFLNSDVIGLSGQELAWVKSQFSTAMGDSEYRSWAESALSMAEIPNDATSLPNFGSMINKNSLDAMFERGNIIQFKTWMGAADYKYGVIVDLTLEKRGTEDDVWRGALTLREMPVLSLTPMRGRVDAPPNQTWVSGATRTFGQLASMGDRVAINMPIFRALIQSTEEATAEGEA